MRNVSATNELSFRQRPFLPFRAATFAVVCLAIGMAAAGLGYALGSVPDANVRRPPIYPQDWMFWGIWFVLYPTMGIAGYHLWRSRSLPGSGLAWRLFVLGFCVNLTWVPIVHLTHSPVAAPAVMDAITGAAFLPALWAIARNNRPAFTWCLPLLVWGVITGSLKIWQLELNEHAFPASTWSILQSAAYAGAFGIAIQIILGVRGFLNHEIR